MLAELTIPIGKLTIIQDLVISTPLRFARSGQPRMKATTFTTIYCLLHGISALVVAPRQVDESREASALWRRSSPSRDRPSSSKDRLGTNLISPKAVKYERPRPPPIDRDQLRNRLSLLQPTQADYNSRSDQRNVAPAQPIRITKPQPPLDTRHASPAQSGQLSRSRSPPNMHLISKQPSILTLERPKQALQPSNAIFHDIPTSRRRQIQDPPRSSPSSSKKAPTKNDSGWLRSTAITSEQVSRSMARSKGKETHPARDDKDISGPTHNFSVLEDSRLPSPDPESREPSPARTQRVAKVKPPRAKLASQQMIAYTSASQPKWIPPPRRPEDGLYWGEDWKTQEIPREDTPLPLAEKVRPGSPPRGYLIPGERDIARERLLAKPGQWAHAVVTAHGPASISSSKPSKSTPYVRSQDGHKIQVEAHDPDYVRLQAGALDGKDIGTGLLKAKVTGKYIRGSMNVDPFGLADYKHTNEAGEVTTGRVTIDGQKYSNTVRKAFGNTHGKMQSMEVESYGDVILDMAASQRPFEEYGELNMAQF